ncbi:CsbD family protein [Xanthomonas maliensis]|uniref:CsbD family protein n=1 Tax=Xanthomonas maliensis TaxID=1321368 RepID=UPI0003A90845|nr:CsbD family protein [Xanthomonas maliensis]KAB7768856.1 CsbD family protein [Xanthomonas maliensis]
MDKNRIEGAAKQVKGSIKETVGHVTGNKRTELEGAAEKNIGKVQRKAGEVADKARDAARSAR